MNIKAQQQQQKIPRIDINKYLNQINHEEPFRNNLQNSHLSFLTKLRSHSRFRTNSVKYSVKHTQSDVNTKRGITPKKQYLIDNKEYNENQERMSLSLKEFQKLKLEDYLKLHITKQRQGFNSKDIIKSLNGTWFKQLENQEVGSRLFNTVGIKRSRASTKSQRQFNPEEEIRLFEENKIIESSRVFPVRKIHTSKSSQSRQHQQRLPQKNDERQAIRQRGNLKNQVLKKIMLSSGERISSSSSKKRQTTIKSNKKIKPFNNQKILMCDNLHILKGTKMMLHK